MSSSCLDMNSFFKLHAIFWLLCTSLEIIDKWTDCIDVCVLPVKSIVLTRHNHETPTKTPLKTPQTMVPYLKVVSRCLRAALRCGTYYQGNRNLCTLALKILLSNHMYYTWNSNFSSTARFLRCYQNIPHDVGWEWCCTMSLNCL